LNIDSIGSNIKLKSFDCLCLINIISKTMVFLDECIAIALTIVLSSVSLLLALQYILL